MNRPLHMPMMNRPMHIPMTLSPGSGFGGFGSRVSGLGFQVLGFRSRVSGFGCRDSCFGSGDCGGGSNLGNSGRGGLASRGRVSVLAMRGGRIAGSGGRGGGRGGLVGRLLLPGTASSRPLRRRFRVSINFVFFFRQLTFVRVI